MPPCSSRCLQFYLSGGYSPRACGKVLSLLGCIVIAVGQRRGQTSRLRLWSFSASTPSSVRVDSTDIGHGLTGVCGRVNETTCGSCEPCRQPKQTGFCACESDVCVGDCKGGGQLQCAQVLGSLLSARVRVVTVYSWCFSANPPRLQWVGVHERLRQHAPATDFLLLQLLLCSHHSVSSVMGA